MINIEISIMRALLTQSIPATIEGIMQATGEQADNITVALEDMAGRGFVALEKGSYRPLMTAPQYCAVEVRKLVDQLYDGDAAAFLADYIGVADPEDRVALEDIINKRDRS